MNEKQIQTKIVQFLQSRGIFCHSVPNELAGGTQSAAIRMGQFIAMGLRKGVADMVVWWEYGTVGYLEVKDAKGKQRKEQKVFEEKCKEHGLRYDLVRSVEDVEQLLYNIRNRKE